MRALSVTQPWTWAILHADKRVENRTWKPPAAIIGQRIALHAGKGYDRLGYEQIRLAFPNLRPPTMGECVSQGLLGAVVGLVTIAGVQAAGSTGPLRDIASDPWASGPWCWLLDDPGPVAPAIPLSGALGLFRLQPSVIRAILDQAKPRP